MPIQIIPHSSDWKDAVLAFNRRMHEGGSGWGFYPDPEPDWIPKSAGAKAWREYYLAVEDDEFVRAGYALKPQVWRVHGRDEWVTDWQGPFTEAAIDPKYSALGLRIVRDMLKKYPLLYSLGHGGNEEPMLQLLRSLGWTLYGTPFCVRVVKPYRFLRLVNYMRERPLASIFFDVLAVTGLGTVGIGSMHAALRLRYHPAAFRSEATVVGSFGKWADEIWDAYKADYQCLAVRDKEMMNRLLPKEGWPGGTRLKVERDGQVIGWSVVHRKQMSNDRRFGDLCVGLVSDCFGAPADAAEIISAAHRHLVAQGVDLVCSNQSHPAWVGGFRSNGYAILKDRRMFALSPQLKERLEPFETTVQGLHLTNMDGHGPHGFEEL